MTVRPIAFTTRPNGAEDLSRAHDLWLRLTENYGAKLHHRDEVGVALRRLEKDLNSDRRQEVIDTWVWNCASRKLFRDHEVVHGKIALRATKAARAEGHAYEACATGLY